MPYDQASPLPKGGPNAAYGSTPRIVILGAGVGGLCTGVQLKRAGIHSFTILEKADKPGGTWRDNTYPGSGCDVPSHLYSFSFEPDWPWDYKFGKQAEIERYLDHVTRKYGLTSHIRYGEEVTAARFDEARGVWHLTTRAGETVEADIVVSGLGQLNRPFTPKIDGLENFEGPVFHSARWDHSVDLKGKKVACIGNGASAIQFVPEIAKEVADLTIFQRTPNWVVPKNDAKYGKLAHFFYGKIPGMRRLHRIWLWLTLERNFLAFRQGSFFGKLFEKAGRKAMEEHITDPDEQKKLLPDYPAGCKRILLSNDWWPALARDNVHVETSHVAHITKDAVVTQDGTRHEADVVIFATGFQSTDFLAPMEIKGRNGFDINEAWRDGAEAYLGMAVSGFPNFFMLYGPNTNLGHNSIIFMIECQVHYILACIKQMMTRGIDVIDVKPEAQTEFNTQLQQDMSRTVWAAGCESWYKTESGKVTNNWSGPTLTYWWRTREPDLSDFDQRIIAPAARQAAA